MYPACMSQSLKTAIVFTGRHLSQSLVTCVAPGGGVHCIPSSSVTEAHRLLEVAMGLEPGSIKPGCRGSILCRSHLASDWIGPGEPHMRYARVPTVLSARCSLSLPGEIEGPSFLPSVLPSSLPSFLPSFLPSLFFLSFLPSFLPCSPLSSVLLSSFFAPFFLPSFLPSSLPSSLPSCTCRYSYDACLGDGILFFLVLLSPGLPSFLDILPSLLLSLLSFFTSLISSFPSFFLSFLDILPSVLDILPSFLPSLISFL